MRGDFVCAETTGLASADAGSIVDLHIGKELGKSGSPLSGSARYGDSHRNVSIHYDKQKSREFER